MKLHGKILGMSVKCFYAVMLACVLGILLGSFFDFQISERLANVTKLGSFFTAYGCCFSYCLYPAAGMCLYKGLKKKGFSMAGTVLLITYLIHAVVCKALLPTDISTELVPFLI